MILPDENILRKTNAEKSASLEIVAVTCQVSMRSVKRCFDLCLNFASYVLSNF